MHELKYISDDEYKDALKTTVNFVGQKTNISAPHFVMFVREYLNEKYGEDFVERGGLKVYTTLDWRLQQEAEKIISEGAAENEKKYKAANAALAALNPKTGQILAMVGSRDYFDIEKEGNVNVAIRPRMPGSAFKPFAYAAAIKKGFTSETVVFDVPTEFSPNTEQCPAEPNFSDNNKICYHPQNYDGKFRGPVSLRSSLAQSLNIPSVKTFYLAGINDTINLAENMGITTLKDRSRYGLSLVLGAGDVKLLELASAYGVFAAEGVKTPPAAILKIEKTDGEILEEYAPQKTKVLDEQTARQITDILSDNEARAPMFGPSSPLYLGERPVAAKTGTTQNYQDAWILGYTPSLVASVWVGNNRNQPMDRGGAGVSAAGPLWNKFMSFALEGEPIEVFNEPDLIQTAKPILNGQWLPSKKIKIDKISGKI
ncbi:MAG: penicillin-binding transpeptidase domain-containing protein, partial [Patescibacteria group bacterium]